MRKHWKLATFLVVWGLVIVAVSAVTATDIVKHFDKVVLGPTAFTTGRLNLSPGTTAANGIYFGNDVTLYRSAADTLKTDDAVSIAGDTTLGDASTDIVTFTGRCSIRQVTDGGMDVTPGTEGEVVYNLADDKVYVCTTTHGTAATWALVGGQS